MKVGLRNQEKLRIWIGFALIEAKGEDLSILENGGRRDRIWVSISLCCFVLSILLLK